MNISTKLDIGSPAICKKDAVYFRGNIAAFSIGLDPEYHDEPIIWYKVTFKRPAFDNSEALVSDSDSLTEAEAVELLKRFKEAMLKLKDVPDSSRERQALYNMRQEDR